MRRFSSLAAAGLLAAAVAACQDHHFVPYDADHPIDPASFKESGEGFASEEGPYQRMNSGTPAPAPMAGSAPAGASYEGVIAAGTVSLGDGVKAEPGRALFIIVRSTAGGPPVAAQKQASVSFPFSFTVTSADAMMGPPSPGIKVTVEARLDEDGDAMSRTAGDLNGKDPAPYDLGTVGIALVLK